MIRAVTDKVLAHGQFASNQVFPPIPLSDPVFSDLVFVQFMLALKAIQCWPNSLIVVCKFLDANFG